MAVKDFSYKFTRVSTAGAAEVAPVSLTDSMVWDLPDPDDSKNYETYDCLALLASGNMDFEVGYWNATIAATASWVVLTTGTLVANTPQVIDFPYIGARIYVRRTSVSVADIRLYAAEVTGGAITSVAIAGGAVGIQGVVSDGAAAGTTKPVIIGGVDVSGNAQNLLVGADGMLGVSSSPAYTHSTDKGDGTATRVTDATFTLVGPTITTDTQLTEVWVHTAAGGVTKYVQGQFGIDLSYSAGTVTMVTPGVAAPVPAGCTICARWIQQDKAYDPASNAMAGFEISPLNLQSVEDILLSGTQATNTTAYYPSSAGLDMTGYKDLSIEFSLQGTDAATDTDVTLTIEFSSDSAFTYPKSVTPAGYELLTNAYGAASFVAYGVAPTTRVNGILDFDNVNSRYARVKVVTSNGTSASQTLQIIARRKAL